MLSTSLEEIPSLEARGGRDQSWRPAQRRAHPASFEQRVIQGATLVLPEIWVLHGCDGHSSITRCYLHVRQQQDLHAVLCLGEWHGASLARCEEGNNNSVIVQVSAAPPGFILWWLPARRWMVKLSDEFRRAVLPCALLR